MNKISKIDITLVVRNLPIILFVVVALVAGSVFIKNRGTFAGPDMNSAHYRASLAVATGQIFTEPTSMSTAKVSYITGSEKYFKSGQACVNSSIVAANMINILDSDDGRDCIREYDYKLSSDKTVSVMAVLQYPALGYIPQATGLGVGMATGMEPITAQTLARYLNLIVYIGLMVIAIILAPRGRWLIAVVGLLPTSLYLASSLSADAMNIAWNMVFVAYIIKLMVEKRRITPKQVATIAILGFGLFMLKVAYVPLLLLVLALSKSVIPRLHKWLLFFGILAAGTFTYALWSAKWGSMNATVNLHDNFNILLGNVPGVVVGLFVNIIYTPLKIFDMQGSLMYFGFALLIAAMVWVYLQKANYPSVKRVGDLVSNYKLHLLGFVAVIGSLGLTYAALLLTWTDVTMHGFMNIQGFQGRYILPLLPLILILYYVPRMGKKKHLS